MAKPAAKKISITPAEGKLLVDRPTHAEAAEGTESEISSAPFARVLKVGPKTHTAVDEFVFFDPDNLMPVGDDTYILAEKDVLATKDPS